MAKKASKKRVRRSREWLERSARAKRGWDTRRLKKNVATATSKVIKTAKRISKPGKGKKKPSISDLQAQLLLQAKELADIKLQLLNRKPRTTKKDKKEKAKLELQIQKLDEAQEFVDIDLDFYPKSREKELLIAELIKNQEKLIDDFDWPDLLPEENLRYDRSIAAQPSRARHRWDTEAAFNYMWNMNLEDRLDEACKNIAEFMDLPLREIYTLWFSP